MNIVICSGVMRSGSTWSYNVSRALLGLAANKFDLTLYASYLEGAGLDDFLLTDDALFPGAAIFKSHLLGFHARQLIAAGIVKNIYTVRDPRDCVASRKTFKDESLEDSIRLVKQSFDTVMSLNSSSLMIKYDHIIKEPEQVIKDIAAYLLMDFTKLDEIAESISEELSVKEMRSKSSSVSGIDPLMELHENHIGDTSTGKWINLPESDLKAIETELKEEINWFLNV